MDQLAAIRAFVRIVETGSFTLAAASVRTPKPTVTKLVQGLEAHLGTKLLTRTTRRLTVTADGAAYYERAVQLLADLAELDGSVTASQARPGGRLRIDVSPVLAQRFIVPALAGFFARYPDIRLDLGASDRAADMIGENVDCVIRAGTLHDQAMIARRIATLHMVTVAAPVFLERHGAPQHPDDLRRSHPTVGFFSPANGRPLPFYFEAPAGVQEMAGLMQVAVNEAGTYLAATLAGHGVAQLPYVMARPHLEAGALTRVLADWPVPALPLHVVYPPNRHLSAKLRVFVDWAAVLFGSAEFAPPG